VNISEIDIYKLKPYKLNAKQHPESQIEGLSQSIKTFGFTQPIVVDKNNEIIIGHGRLEAAKKAGLKNVPIVKRDDLTANEVKALRLIDNRIAETSWDSQLLHLDLSELDYDLSDFNIDFEDLAIEPEEYIGQTDEDDIPEVEESITKVGDVWLLGEHRLLCGDNSSKEDVARLMDGKKADMVFTDPPYGISVVKPNGNIGVDRKKEKCNAKANARVYRSVIGDDKPYDPTPLLELSDKHVIWGANNFASKLPDNAKWIVWDKKMARDNDFSSCELAWTSLPGKSITTYDFTWAGMVREGNRKEELKDRVHPTQKPVGLCGKILNDFGGKTILDPFLGSGSTLIACEKTNRICYGMEIDPHYCDVIVKRWQDFTGKEAELEKEKA